jgi:hypothetical protein
MNDRYAGSVGTPVAPAETVDRDLARRPLIAKTAEKT